MVKTGSSVPVIERRGLREQVYDSVLRMLLEGRIESGERLSIESMARTLDVSPTPVREAFVMLERTGLVSRVALKGYRVAPPLNRSQLAELFDARSVLEVAAARGAYAHRQDLVPRLEEITKVHDGHALRVSKLEGGRGVPLEETQAYFRSDEEFHRAIFQAAGNRYLNDMYETLGALTHRMRQMATHGPEDAQEAMHEHHAILDAYRDGGMEEVAAAMAQHIENVRSRSLPRAEQ